MKETLDPAHTDLGGAVGMRSRFLALIGGLLSLIGCTDLKSPIKTQAGKLTQAQIDEIVDKCGGARDMVLLEQNVLLIYPAQDFTITGCVLEALQATGETTLSSVGNQRYDPSESSNSQTH